MRIHEIINEDKDYTKTKNKVVNSYSNALTGVHTVSGTSDRFYDLYRLGLKVAEADGVHPLKTGQESWAGRNNVISPYTQEEAQMMKHAYKANNLLWTDKLSPNTKNKSKESEDVYVVSPVASLDWKKKRS